MEVKEDTFHSWLHEGYPRPQLCRHWYHSLNGTWSFAIDPKDVGVDQSWFSRDWGDHFPLEINVPFPPGSKLSAIFTDDPDSVPDIVWYHRRIVPQELSGLPPNQHLLVNFEAVDFRATVWANGNKVGEHVGGYAPFTLDLGIPDPGQPVNLVVRAEDRRSDLTQPRGKQSWQEQPEGIWYRRSTGIWRDVWLESVPPAHIRTLNWVTNLEQASVRGDFSFNTPVPAGSMLSVHLALKGHTVAEVNVSIGGGEASIDIPIPSLSNRVEWSKWLWEPSQPNLLDAQIELHVPEAEPDRIVSYLGLRTVGLSNRYLTVSSMPIYLRGVLDQGYWPESFFTAPTALALRDDLMLARNLGFNLVRVHERSPDRRYLAWADSLGMMVWIESASAWSFSTVAMQRTIEEWTQLVIRDRASPSVVAWVPFNESWGVSAIATSSQQRHFVDGVVALTRALDPTRPVSANDGWEQLSTDIVTTHDYGTTGESLYANYCSVSAVAQTVNGVGPQGRRTILGKPWNDDRPVIVSEFGGISTASGNQDAWGYEMVDSTEVFEDKVGELFDALIQSPVLAGFCYTQLTDTEQETNGLCTGDRTPKVPLQRLRNLITSVDAHASQIRPRLITTNAMGAHDYES